MIMMNQKNSAPALQPAINLRGLPFSISISVNDFITPIADRITVSISPTTEEVS